MFLAGSIFLLTLVLVIWQPRGLSIGWSASIGAALALGTGVIHIADVPVVWNIVWNATAAFIVVIIISLLLDESGFFEWAALHVSSWGNGRGRLLFTWIVLLGAAVAALFANDGAALILTPIVIAMLLALGFSQGTTLAFVMAAGFIADTASLPLIVSNLVNIVSADFFGLGFTQYASVMIPVDVAAITATLVMLHLFFRRDIPVTCDVSLLKTPASVIKDPATFRAGWIVLLLLLVGFFVLEPLGIPVSAIAAAGAAARCRAHLAAARPAAASARSARIVRYATPARRKAHRHHPDPRSASSRRRGSSLRHPRRARTGVGAVGGPSRGRGACGVVAGGGANDSGRALSEDAERLEYRRSRTREGGTRWWDHACRSTDVSPAQSLPRAPSTR